MLPMNAQRRMFDRLNKSLGTESKVTLANNQEKGRSAVLKKIVMYSSHNEGYHRSNSK